MALGVGIISGADDDSECVLYDTGGCRDLSPVEVQSPDLLMVTLLTQSINAGSFSTYVRDRVFGDHDGNITPSSFPAPGLMRILSSYPSQSPDGVDVLLVGKRDDVVHCGLSRVRDKEGTDVLIL